MNIYTATQQKAGAGFRAEKLVRLIIVSVTSLQVLLQAAVAQTGAAPDSVTAQIKHLGLDTIKDVSKRPHLYRMNYWVSGTFSALATAGNIYAIPNILHAKKKLNDQEIAALNRDIINGFDRMALYMDPTKRDKFYKISDIMLPAMMLAPAVLAFDRPIRADWPRMAVMFYEVQATAFSLYNFSPFGPAFQNRLRPVVYYPQIAENIRRSGGSRNSFFSGHTAQTAASAFFIAKLYSDYHPELGKRKYLLFGLATLPPLVQGYFRIKALAHFPSDVLAGVILGAVCGVGIPELHRYRDRKIHFDVSFASGAPGIGISWKPQKEQRLLKTFSGSGPAKP